MSFLTIPFPAIDPVIFAVGPFVVRWYALAYIAGLLIGWRLLLRFVETEPRIANRHDADDFLVWATLGIILGGRLGYVLFYNFSHYAANPMAALQVWKGGMSFHGGLIGVILAGTWFCKRRAIPMLGFGDLLARVTPVGLFFGRLANFINGELYGRPSDAPWAVVFPRGGPAPRHPSQIYEALLEGLLLFVVINFLARSAALRGRPGLLMGVFLAGYAISRMIVELFRQPDAHIGFLNAGTTLGQWLSLPMFLIGLYFIVTAKSRAPG